MGSRYLVGNSLRGSRGEVERRADRWKREDCVAISRSTTRPPESTWAGPGGRCEEENRNDQARADDGAAPASRHTTR